MAKMMNSIPVNRVIMGYQQQDARKTTMPPLHLLVLASLLLISPLYSIALILLDTHTPPYRRSVLALGSGVLLKTAIVAALGLLALISESRVILWLPLMGLGVVSLAVARVMQLETGSKI
jgi:hypothetical protein